MSLTISNGIPKALEGVYSKLKSGFNSLSCTLKELFPRYNSYKSFRLNGTDGDSFVYDPSQPLNKIVVTINTVVTNFTIPVNTVSYSVTSGTANLDNNNVAITIPAGLSESIEASDTIATPISITPDNNSIVHVTIRY